MASQRPHVAWPVKYIEIPNMIQGMLLNSARLGSLGIAWPLVVGHIWSQPELRLRALREPNHPAPHHMDSQHKLNWFLF